MANLDDLALVASQFLQNYNKVQDVIELRDKLSKELDPEDAPLYQKSRISLVSISGELITVELPISMPLVQTVSERLGLLTNESLQELAEMSSQVYHDFKEALRCQTKTPSTSPAPGSTATTATG